MHAVVCPWKSFVESCRSEDADRDVEARKANVTVRISWRDRIVGNCSEWSDEVLKLGVGDVGRKQSDPNCNSEIGLVFDKVIVRSDKPKGRFAFDGEVTGLIGICLSLDGNLRRQELFPEFVVQKAIWNWLAVYDVVVAHKMEAGVFRDGYRALSTVIFVKRVKVGGSAFRKRV